MVNWYLISVGSWVVNQELFNDFLWLMTVLV